MYKKWKVCPAIIPLRSCVIVPSTGTKNPLLLRLHHVPIEQSGEYLADEYAYDSEEILSEGSYKNNAVGATETSAFEKGDEINKSTTNECETNDGIIHYYIKLLGRLMKKELDIVNGEKELLRRENDLLRKIALFEKRSENKTSENVVVNVSGKQTECVCVH